MNNEHEHLFDDCIGNPPFAEALKTLGGGLTDAQQRFFDENKARVSNLQEGATDNEKKLAGIAKLFINYSEEMQRKLNGMKRELEKIESSVKAQNGTRAKSNDEKFKMWNCLVSCYCAINRHFGDQIRAQLAYNDETAKQSQIRKLTAELERIAKK